jgi:glutamate dehydrogenase
LPARLAESIAVLEPLKVAPDLVELMRICGAGARAVARTHFGLGARLGLDWLHATIEQLPASGSWSSAARAQLQDASFAAHRQLSATALAPEARADTRERRSAAANALARWQQVLGDARALASPDLAALSVVVEALEALAAAEAAPPLP